MHNYWHSIRLWGKLPVMHGKRYSCIFFLILQILSFAVAERRMGIGAELLFTGTIPPGGGGGLSVRLEKIPLNLTVSGAYLYGNHGTVKGTLDYWFLSEKITDIKPEVSFNWFAGIGFLADTVFYSIPAADAAVKNKTALGGGFGMRMPIGCYFYAGQEKYEPYVQFSPEFGVRIYPNSFSKRVSVLWSFPVSAGLRFWF